MKASSREDDKRPERGLIGIRGMLPSLVRGDKPFGSLADATRILKCEPWGLSLGRRFEDDDKKNATSQREAAFESTLCLLAVCDSQKPRGSLCSPGTEPHVLKTAKNDSGFAFLASAKIRRCVAGLLLNLVTAGVAASTASAATTAIVVAAEDGVAQVANWREQVAQQVAIVVTA